MRYLATLTLACVSCAPVPAAAIELGGTKVIVTPEERHLLTQCHRQGGCVVVSSADVMQLIQEVQLRTIEVAASVAKQEIEKAVALYRKGQI